MGQKINPQSLRLKKRLNWKSLLGCDYKDYGFLSIQNYNVSNLINIIFSKYNYYLNDSTVIKDSKNIRFTSKVLSELDFTKELIKANQSKNFSLETQQSARSHNLKNKKENLNIFNLNVPKLVTEVSNFNTVKNNTLVKYSTSNFLIIFPQLINSYIVKQMSEPNKLKNTFFNKSLQLGIMKLISTLLTYQIGFRKPRSALKNIVGFKLICSGRWKKTKAGRTQTLKFNYGQTKRTSVVSTMFYSFKTQKTKYASCGFKIWIAYKM